MFQWVLVHKVVELVGYSEDAIRCKIKKGVWLRDIHWRKAPDGRILVNLEAVRRWIEGKTG
jgi:hypothetical protein